MTCRRAALQLLVSLSALLLCATAGGGARAPAPPAQTRGIGLIKWGGSTSGSNWNELTHTDRYSVITVGPANARRAAKLPGRSLLYACGAVIPNAPWSGQCGIPWSTAVENGWVLKNADGSYVAYRNYDYLYLADVGNPAYQRAWVSAIAANIRKYRVRGVWIDNVIGNLIAPTAAYPDDASYRAAVESFMDFVGPALRKRGFYVAAEAIMVDTATPGWYTTFGDQCNGAQALWWYRRIAPDVDGFATEYWQMSWYDGTVRHSGPDSCNGANWDGWERLVSVLQRLGKDFFPLTSGTADAAGVDKSTYLKASFLLDYNGGTSALIYAAGGNGNYDAVVDDWMSGAPWTMDLGPPGGPKRRVGVGWLRRFAGGIVVIDPDATTPQQFALGGRYLSPQAGAVTSVTVDPAHALILRRMPGAAP